MRSNISKLGAVGAVFALAVSIVAAIPAPASAASSPIILRPNATVSNNWSVSPSGIAAWDAIDDPIVTPNAVDASNYLYGSQPGRVAELGFPDPAYHNPYAWSTAWFYANTGATTRLKAEVLVNGAVVTYMIVPAGQGFSWQQLNIPEGALDGYAASGLSLRFTSLDGGDTNVRAAYVQTYSGMFQFRNGFYSTAYMDALAGSTLVGVRQPSNTFNQQFTSSETRLGNVLFALGSGTCLGIQNGSNIPGTLLTQQACGATGAQYFTFVPVSVGKSLIKVNQNGLCLSVSSLLWVQQAQCYTASPQQQWTIFRNPR